MSVLVLFSNPTQIYTLCTWCLQDSWVCGGSVVGLWVRTCWGGKVPSQTHHRPRNARWVVNPFFTCFPFAKTFNLPPSININPVPYSWRNELTHNMTIQHSLYPYSYSFLPFLCLQFFSCKRHKQSQLTWVSFSVCKLSLPRRMYLGFVVTSWPTFRGVVLQFCSCFNHASQNCAKLDISLWSSHARGSSADLQHCNVLFSRNLAATLHRAWDCATCNIMSQWKWVNMTSLFELLLDLSVFGLELSETLFPGHANLNGNVAAAESGLDRWHLYGHDAHH